ncbi:acyl-CoA dehydrogenase family protein [Granulicella sp. dw_53]|uniref:acyl-CoA dehydrogenase family protein n=1 Tax=Granulicella sp. dw_53 TaxID=2719792 RepID=UPI001BD3042D|nr:acyl-CoA dehydrogenase family protein [Granulicella sp. dw_53]
MNELVETTAEASEFVAAAQGLGTLIDENREALAKGPDLPQPIADALIRAGLTQLWMPRSLGGPEIDPLGFVEAIEALAKLDGATAWCASISSGASRFSGAIPAGTMRKLLPTGSTFAFNGSGHPSGAITRDGEGWRVSGRWTWMSFSRYSDIFVLMCIEHENGEPLFAPSGMPKMRAVLLPAKQVQVGDNWNGGGLRSSGSNDVVCKDVYVPDNYTTTPDVPDRQPGPLYDLPMTSAAAIMVIGVPLGIASASIDSLIALAGTKVPFFSQVPLSEQEIIQLEVAWAKTRLHSARAFAVEAISSLWASVSAGRPVSAEQQAMLRMACRNVGEAGKEIVGRMYSAAGSTAVLEDQPFSAQLRDVYAASQHINFAARLMVTPGRILLGFDPGTNQI